MNRRLPATHSPLFVTPEGNLRLLLLLSSPVLCNGLLAQQPRQLPGKALAFSFPGPRKTVPSSNGQFAAHYKKLSEDEFAFYMTAGGEATFSQHPFARSVEGAWSPGGTRLYLNDFMGSTQIDCLVWTPQRPSLLSLTEALLHDPNSGPVQGGGAKPPENPSNSRFELTCGGWQSQARLSVTLQGATWAGGQFRYELSYDLTTNRFTWRNAASLTGTPRPAETQIPFGNDKQLLRN